MIGVAIAYAILQCVYSVFNYSILIRTLIGPCLREYVNSMWPSLRASGTMACLVFVVGIFLKVAPTPVALAIQVVFGIAVYLALMFYGQKMLFFEIRDIVRGRNV